MVDELEYGVESSWTKHYRFDMRVLLPNKVRLHLACLVRLRANGDLVGINWENRIQMWGASGEGKCLGTFLSIMKLEVSSLTVERASFQFMVAFIIIIRRQQMQIID
ncbi:hypothetical protein TIFTF001_017958 [Ficus carica]|uniref:Uncharacterized protein n=1 Tax=Ficus carica TaxID=3494 RepID=A0AA88ARH4_FICCA|nr:hypothetical protein TIFTF001_017958 [Ficus carica]